MKKTAYTLLTISAFLLIGLGIQCLCLGGHRPPFELFTWFNWLLQGAFFTMLAASAWAIVDSLYIGPSALEIHVLGKK